MLNIGDEYFKDDISFNLSEYYIAEGDIIKPKNPISQKKSLNSRLKRKTMKSIYSSGFSSRWPYGIVPYEFDYEIG